jgi:hypothetical protein
MYNNEKLRIYIILFLSFCVLSSKNILIYNEETLVALSFFCFLFFVYRYFGLTIRESLNERSQYVQYELQKFFTLKANSYKELLKEHQKIKGLIKEHQKVKGFLKDMKNIDIFTNRECTRLKVYEKKALIHLFLLKLQQKLKNLVFSYSILQQKLQYLLSEKVFFYFLLFFQKAKQQKMKTGDISTRLQKKPIKKALQLLALNA